MQTAMHAFLDMIHSRLAWWLSRCRRRWCPRPQAHRGRRRERGGAGSQVWPRGRRDGPWCSAGSRRCSRPSPCLRHTQLHFAVHQKLRERLKRQRERIDSNRVRTRERFIGEEVSADWFILDAQERGTRCAPSVYPALLCDNYNFIHTFTSLACFLSCIFIDFIDAKQWYFIIMVDSEWHIIILISRLNSPLKYDINCIIFLRNYIGIQIEPHL